MVVLFFRNFSSPLPFIMGWVSDLYFLFLGVLPFPPRRFRRRKEKYPAPVEISHPAILPFVSRTLYLYIFMGYGIKDGERRSKNPGFYSEKRGKCMGGRFLSLF